jgi:hypothetical protein
MGRPTTARSTQRIVALGFALICAAAAASAQQQAPSDRLVHRFVELVRRGDFETARTLFDADALPRIENKALILLHHALERIEDPEIRFVHLEAAGAGDATGRETWAYQLRDDMSSILLIVKVRTRDSKPGIAHIEWQPAPLDLRERFPFVLAGVPFPLRLVLVAAIAVPLLTLHALVLCWRRRPRAWGLWTLFIPLGLGKLSVLWLPNPFHPSYVHLTPLSIQLFGVGLEKNPSYDPWMLSVSLPLGALLFLLSRHWMRGDGGGSATVCEGSEASGPPGPAAPRGSSAARRALAPRSIARRHFAPQARRGNAGAAACHDRFGCEHPVGAWPGPAPRGAR